MLTMELCGGDLSKRHGICLPRYVMPIQDH